MYKLLIVEDEPLIRRGIKTLIDFGAMNIEQCYEAEDGQEGYGLFLAHSPELVLLDINLPLMNGIELAELIKKHRPQTKVAMITGYDYFDYAVSALRLGVDEYVLKPVSRTDISKLLFKLIEDYEAHAIEAALTETLRSSMSTPGLAPEGETPVSYKEQILKVLEEQLHNPEFSLALLAGQLNLSANYLSGMFKSLFGQPFQDYVMHKRLEKAKLLLLTSTLRVYEIAEQVGFEDVNYFSTRFKKAYGVPPKQFLQKVRDSYEQVEQNRS